MTDRLVLKKLTSSDLTIFEWQFRNHNAGNQKAINLNADVFIGDLYPAAPNIAPTVNNEFPVSLSIFGPGLESEYKVARKIIKNPSYKNWRLNGEFIHNPEDSPKRFNSLQPGDLAIMSFSGENYPKAIALHLVSVSSDKKIHNELSSLLNKRSMVSLDRNLLAALINKYAQENHPIRNLLLDTALDSALEDAALGGEKGIRALLKRPSTKNLTLADLTKARINAERIGREGEELINVLLERKRNEGKLTSFKWTASENILSPYDFEILVGKVAIILDVKSTEGPFERAFHISLSELKEAAGSKARYDLYRVYNLTQDGGKVRISEDIREYAAKIIKVIDTLPKGIKPDSFSIEPSSLEWTNEITELFPEENPPDSGV